MGFILNRVADIIKEDDLPRSHGTVPTTGDQFPYVSNYAIQQTEPADRKFKDMIKNFETFTAETRVLPMEKKIELLNYFSNYVFNLDLKDIKGEK